MRITIQDCKVLNPPFLSPSKLATLVQMSYLCALTGRQIDRETKYLYTTYFYLISLCATQGMTNNRVAKLLVVHTRNNHGKALGFCEEELIQKYLMMNLSILFFFFDEMT